MIIRRINLVLLVFLCLFSISFVSSTVVVETWQPSVTTNGYVCEAFSDLATAQAACSNSNEDTKRCDYMYEGAHCDGANNGNNYCSGGHYMSCAVFDQCTYSMYARTDVHTWVPNIQGRVGDFTQCQCIIPTLDGDWGANIMDIYGSPPASIPVTQAECSAGIGVSPHQEEKFWLLNGASYNGNSLQLGLVGSTSGYPNRWMADSNGQFACRGATYQANVLVFNSPAKRIAGFREETPGDFYTKVLTVNPLGGDDSQIVYNRKMQSECAELIPSYNNNGDLYTYNTITRADISHIAGPSMTYNGIITTDKPITSTKAASYTMSGNNPWESEYFHAKFYTSAYYSPNQYGFLDLMRTPTIGYEPGYKAQYPNLNDNNIPYNAKIVCDVIAAGKPPASQVSGKLVGADGTVFRTDGTFTQVGGALDPYNMGFKTYRWVIDGTTDGIVPENMKAALYRTKYFKCVVAFNKIVDESGFKAVLQQSDIYADFGTSLTGRESRQFISYPNYPRYSFSQNNVKNILPISGQERVGCSFEYSTTSNAVITQQVKFTDQQGAALLSKSNVNATCRNTNGKMICSYTLNDTDTTTLIDKISSINGNDKRVSCSGIVQGIPFNSNPILISFNLKDKTKYYDKKTVFIENANDWRNALQWVPVSMWDTKFIPNQGQTMQVSPDGTYPTGNLLRDDWCNAVHRVNSDKSIDSTMCAYPLLMYNKNGNDLSQFDMEANPGIMMEEPDDNLIREYIPDFIMDYGATNGVGVKPDNDAANGGSITDTFMSYLPFSSSTYGVNKDDWKTQWKSAGNVIVVDYDNKKMALYATELATWYNAPIVFVGNYNYNEWGNYLKNKVLIVVGDLQCGTCAQQLKQDNIILTYDFVGHQLKYDSTRPFTYTFFNEDEVKTFIKYVSYGNVRPANARLILTNPEDTQESYCESLGLGNSPLSSIFDHLYCSHSLLVPQLASATNSIMEFVNSPPSSGTLERKESENNVLNSYNTNPYIISDIPEGYEDLLADLTSDAYQKSVNVRPTISAILNSYPSLAFVLINAGEKGIPSGSEDYAVSSNGLSFFSLDENYFDFKDRFGPTPDNVSDLPIEKRYRNNAQSISGMSTLVNKEIFSINENQ